MTVRDLMATLEKLPPDLEVFRHDADWANVVVRRISVGVRVHVVHDVEEQASGGSFRHGWACLGSGCHLCEDGHSATEGVVFQ